MTSQPPPTSALSGPPVSAWLGFFPEFRQDSLGFLLRCHAYGDVVKLPMGRIAALLLREQDPAMYLLNNSSDIKHVLVTNQDNYIKAPVPPVESLVFGQGVLHTEPPLHHRQRRLFLPFFHADHVASFAELIVDQTSSLVATWQEGATIDIGREMTKVTLSVIWRLLFGQDVGNKSEEVMEAITTGQALIKLQYDSLIMRMMPLWLPTTLHRRFSRGHRYLDETIRRFIRERRATPRQSRDLLDLLLSATDAEGRPLADDEIRDHLMTFLLAGHETTANALTWTWFLISRFNSVQARLVQELETVLKGRLPAAADMQRLRYTKMIWNEVLRLYPPAWLLHTRMSRSEDKLPSGALLPPGSRVFICPWSMHRNPQWFPNPERFDPERFSEEAEQQRPAFRYIPFGGGGRRCLGESFAEMEGILIVATLASKVCFRLLEGQTILPDPLMTLRPQGPVQMTVEILHAHHPCPAPD